MSVDELANTGIGRNEFMERRRTFNYESLEYLEIGRFSFCTVKCMFVFFSARNVVVVQFRIG